MTLLRGRFARFARGAIILGAACLGVTCLVACDDDALAPRQADAGAPFGLSRDQAAAVVAKVGDRIITLGDYAMLLERMTNIDRSRYESKKRRRDLLQEMIDIELLAQEARRRGLDKNPEVQDAIRQVLRDAMRSKIQDSVRPPGRITPDEVKAYYDAHLEDFREPERRRVSAIVLGDPEKAREVLELALALKNDADWGGLFFAHSLTAPAERNPNDAPELAGSLDMVGPPGDIKGSSSKVPKTVQAAVFELDSVGDIYDKVVPGGSRYYIVRMSGQAKARTRSLEMSGRTIRMSIFQQEQREAEEQAVAELRKQLDISVNDSVVRSITLPATLKNYQPFWDEVAPPPAASSAASSAAPAASSAVPAASSAVPAASSAAPAPAPSAEPDGD